MKPWEAEDRCRESQIAFEQRKTKNENKIKRRWGQREVSQWEKLFPGEGQATKTGRAEAIRHASTSWPWRILLSLLWRCVGLDAQFQQSRGRPPPEPWACGTPPCPLPALLTQCTPRRSSSGDLTRSTKWRPAEQGSALTHLLAVLSTLSKQSLLSKSLSFLPSWSLSKVRRKRFIKALTGLWCWASALLPFPFPVEPAALLEGSNLLPRREPSTEQ